MVPISRRVVRISALASFLAVASALHSCALKTPEAEVLATRTIAPDTEPVSEATVRSTTGPTASPSPSETAVEGPQAACPSPDGLFLDLTLAVDRALHAGDFDFVIANTKATSEVCQTDFGPCAGQPAGTVLSGYVVAVSPSDYYEYLTEAEYVSLLQEIAGVRPEATDRYGGSGWQVAGILETGTERRWIVTTTIGPDPIRDLTSDERRAFSLAARYDGARWLIEELVTEVFVEEILEGRVVVWKPWPEAYDETVDLWTPDPACPASRIRPGHCTWVSLYPVVPNNLRDAPGSAEGKIVGSLDPGEGLVVESGPVCKAGTIWWEVHTLDSTKEGWTAEGEGTDYWLAPGMGR